MNAPKQKATGISPTGMAQYPYLNKPDTKFNADGEYKVSLLLGGDESESLRDRIDGMTAAQGEVVRAELQDKINQAKTGADKAKLKKSLDNLTTNVPYDGAVDDNGDFNGEYVFKFKTKASFKDKKTGKTITRAIKLFDAKKNVTTAAVFGGSRIKVAYEIAPYFVSGSGAYGVSLRINAIQIIELSQGGGGGNASAYGFGEEDGFEADPADEVTTAKADSEADESDDF
jgi:hypothetical protein